jgi:oligopeptidase B
VSDPKPILSPADLAPEMGAPPVAAREPKSHEHHGRNWTDDYDWLRDPGYPKVEDERVLEHLRAENAYFVAAYEPHAELVETLFQECKARIKEDDESVPFKDGDWLYGWRFAKGAQYRSWYRKPVGGGEEQVLIDETALAEGLPYFRLGSWSVSDDGRLLAWTADEDGSERFRVHVKNLETGELLSDLITGANAGVTWDASGSTLLWCELSEQHRPYRVRAHRLGDDGEDTILYEEEGDFFCSVGRTQSRSYIVIGAGDHVTSELRLVPADDAFAEQVLVAEREAGHEYGLDEANGTLYIRTNDAHRNFRVVTAPVASPGRENWRELIPSSDQDYIRGLSSFSDYIALEERVGGLDRIRLRFHDGREQVIAFPESACTVFVATNAEPAAPELRISYQSMVTPPTVYDYSVAKNELATLKVLEIPSGYDASLYETERLMAPARDGVQVPITLVRRKDQPAGEPPPVYLYAYGAYGHGMTPYFSTARLSLLDRGFTWAIAHVRGGDELGYGWYEDGKLERRENTFNDFVDCARFLVAEGRASEGNIAISGGSAGGELVGAVVNQAPGLWRAAAAHVPFVDVLHTILDATLPLTPLEWPEWGNPIEDEKAFETIRSYCPYQNVGEHPYPPMLVTAGLSDPRVTYWEPAKWVAKLRATKTDANVLLLKTNMEAGHGGKSGRFDSLRETAEEQAFMLLAFGLA